MQTNKAFNNISIDSANRKKTSFHAPFDVNTTFGFGDIQPLQCKLCVPNSKVSFNMASIVRLAPMVAPTFTRMKYKTWTSFVGMSDLVKNFENFILKRPRTSGTPGTILTTPSVPTARLGVLSCYCLVGARVSVYELSSASSWDPNGHYTAWNSYDFTSSAGASSIASLTSDSNFRGLWRNRRVYPEFNGANLCAISMVGLGLGSDSHGAFTSANYSWVPIQNDISDAQTGGSYLGYNDLFNGVGSNAGDRITLDNADYVINFTRGGKKLAIAFRLSEFGKRLRKVLIGCGYQIDFRSKDEVSLLPLAAVYKAYFDSFGLCLYTNYEVSPMNQFLSVWSSGTSSAVSVSNLYADSSSYSTLFARAMVDLGTMFVTDSQDFISAHMESDAVGQKFVPGFVNNIVLSPNYDSSSNLEQNLGQESFDINQYYGAVKADTNHVYINKVNHSEVDAEVLKRLYKFTNRNTIAGQRIAKLLEAGGYGSYVKEQKSSFVGYSEIEIDIDDVNCTADSYNAAGDNTSLLGEYVGKGFGFDKEAAKKTFTYENEEFGYLVTLAAIVPESGYTEGMDMTLFDVKPEDFYQADFDGLGMELTKKHVVKSTEDWTSLDSNDEDVPHESFGVVPRFSRYKVTKNVLNGDFSLRGARAAYLPYTLDKFIQAGDRVVSGYSDISGGAGQLVGVYKQPTLKQLPIAGDSWRYASRWPWLNSFGRIFAQYDVGVIPNDVSATDAVLAYELTHTGNDHFLVHNIVNFRMYAPMLPIADSYGTTDENDGRGDMTMAKA